MNKTHVIIGVSSAAAIATTIIIVSHYNSAANKILRCAGKWVGNKEIYSNQGWENKDFQNLMKSAGWWPGAEWCNLFVRLVFRTVCKKGSDAYNFWDTHLSPSTQTTWSNLQAKSKYHSIMDKPEKGSLVIYRSNSDSTKGHIEIVEKVNKDGSYEVISGNSPLGTSSQPQGVAHRHRAKTGISGFKILGFVKIKKI